MALAGALAVGGWAGWSGGAWAFGAAAFGAAVAGVWLGGWMWLAGWLAAGCALAGWIWSGGWEWAERAEAPMPLVVGFFAAGVLLGFLRILGQVERGAGVEEGRGRLGWALAWCCFLGAGVLIADRFASWSTAWLLGVLGVAGFGVLAVDTLCKAMARLYTPKRYRDGLADFGDLWVLRLGKRRGGEPVRRDEDEGLRLSEMWMWPVVRRSLPALVFVALALAWLGTGVHELEAGKRGVRETLGRMEERELSPGLHFSAPWPLGRVRSVDAEKLREVVLGFQADLGQPILWERAHYEREEISMVEGGDSYLSISVPIHYRVRDVVTYLRHVHDPEGLLKGLADGILSELTVARRASGVMTIDREELREALWLELQRELDARGTGLELAGVHLRDIHPPVDVAPFFQEVVAAMEEKEAAIHFGEDYRNDNVVRAEGNAKALLVAAEADHDNRLSLVTGEVARFAMRSDARAMNPGLHDLREGFAVFDSTLAWSKKAVVDERMTREVPTMIDLRQVLNPDLVDRAPPKPQSLISRPARSREAFDREIEGFLMRDQGEIPAPDFAPVDLDNVLKNDGNE